MSSVRVPIELTENHLFYDLSVIPTKNKRLNTLFVATSLESAMDQMLLLDTPGTAYRIERGEIYCQGPVSGVGHCGLLKIVNSQSRVGAPQFDRTLLKCTVPCCLAEYEYRSYAQPGDDKPVFDRPGLLMVKATHYSARLRSVNYEEFGFLKEHRHSADAKVSVIPHVLKAVQEGYIRSQTDFPDPASAAKTILSRFEPISNLVFSKLKALCSISISHKRKREADGGHCEMITPEVLQTASIQGTVPDVAYQPLCLEED